MVLDSSGSWRGISRLPMTVEAEREFYRAHATGPIIKKTQMISFLET